MQRSHLLAMRLFSFCDLHIIMEISLSIQTGSAAEAEGEREMKKKCVVIVVADSPPSALDPFSSGFGCLLLCASGASKLPPPPPREGRLVNAGTAGPDALSMALFRC